MKKLLCIIFSCVFLFSLTSCAFIDRLQGDMSQLDYNEEGYLLYNEITYYRADDRFAVITEDNDKVVELGWQSQFPFFPDMHYYAFDEDNPSFIFCENGESTLYTKGVYVRSDYDLYTQVYTVENSNIEIPLVSAMTQSGVETTAIDHETSMYLKMFLKKFTIDCHSLPDGSILLTGLLQQYAKPLVPTTPCPVLAYPSAWLAGSATPPCAIDLGHVIWQLDGNKSAAPESIFAERIDLM